MPRTRTRDHHIRTEEEKFSVMKKVIRFENWRKHLKLEHSGSNLEHLPPVNTR
jgi:DNA topoisomerase IA